MTIGSIRGKAVWKMFRERVSHQKTLFLQSKTSTGTWLLMCSGDIFSSG